MKNDLRSKIENIINNPIIEENDIIYQLNKCILENELKNDLEVNPKSVSELIFEKANYLRSKDYETNLFKTGFKYLDRIDGGFLLSEFIVIGGRPAMGKSVVLMNLAINISKTHSILYFTYDTSKDLLINHFMSNLTKTYVSQFLKNDLSVETISLLSNAEIQFKNPIYISDSCSQSISTFKAYCLEQIQQKGVKVIMIDCLQMMTTNKFRNNRESEMSYISLELKKFAKEHQVCIVATSQLSRAVEYRDGDKAPVLSDLRESGSLEQNADKVIFINRPEYYNITEDENGNSTKGIIKLKVAKNNNGNLDEINLRAAFEYYLICDLEYVEDSHNSEFSASDSMNFDFSVDRLNELEF